ncbi:unnamed protein product [Schistosoma margrebowiei]|uniref:PAP_fibrillin domain-containing protein n=3 Tax=Schistosoma TaxID=6181 RepID=A0AA85A6W6_9TREM|nr:unnamed protein product [Schistosoma margrebowiei]
MSAVWRVAATHPKKLVAGTLCLVYCYKFTGEKYRDYVLHREICSHVSSENYKTVNSTQPLRSLTVFVNPFSRRGGLLKEFENNAAPILNLSGLDVKMVYLDTDSEIKDFIKVLDPSSTDGVLVVGDDNLIQKAVTSLLSRDDFKTTPLWSLPVGAVPVGIWNGLINSICEKTVVPKWFYNVLHSVLQQNTKRRNVLEVKVISDDSQPIEQSKASSANTYSLLGIEWNIWRDIELGGGCGVSDRHKKPTNPNDHRGVLTTLSVSSPRSWSRNLGALWRSTWYWLRSSENNAQIYPHSDSKTSSNFFADSSVTISEKKLEKSRVKFARLTYTPVCTGCSKCWEKKLMSYKESGVEVNAKKSSSLLGRIFGFSLSSNNNKSNIDEVKSIEIQQQIKAKSSIDNPACEELKELIVEKASGFTITPEGDHIRLDILRRSTSYWDHIRQFRSWLLSQPYSFKSGSQVVLCDKLRLFPGQTENEFYWIDNDYFEAHPIEVNLRRNAINLFM